MLREVGVVDNKSEETASKNLNKSTKIEGSAKKKEGSSK